MRHISRFIYELIRVTISIQWKVSFFMFCFKWKYTIITTQKKKNIYIYIWINFKEGLKVNCPFQNEFPWKFSLSMFGIINTFLFLNFKVSQSIQKNIYIFYFILEQKQQKSVMALWAWLVSCDEVLCTCEVDATYWLENKLPHFQVILDRDFCNLSARATDTRIRVWPSHQSVAD